MCSVEYQCGMGIKIRNIYYYLLSGQRYSFFHWLHRLTLPLTHRISLNSGKDLAAARRSMPKPSTHVYEGTWSQVSPSPGTCLETLGTLFPPACWESKGVFPHPNEVNFYNSPESTSLSLCTHKAHKKNSVWAFSMSTLHISAFQPSWMEVVE